MMRTVILGSGSYIPKNVVPNSSFLDNEFFDEHGQPYDKPNPEIIDKFKAITHIEERRYMDKEQVNSDLAYLAAQRAIEDANIDPETLDYIIVSSNFGDIKYGQIQSDYMPTMASKVKHQLRIKNPKTVAYDIIYGCPGWLEGFIQAHAFIQSGIAKRCLVIGSDALSRVIDVNDRNAMIFADGAGAVVVEGQDADSPEGVLTHDSLTYTLDEAYYLYNGTSFHPENDEPNVYIKMHGRKIYEFALLNVPGAIKSTIEAAGLDIQDISKVLIHQANEKMDQAIISRLFRLYGIREVPDSVMPMTINKLGNSSVATIPTMLDLIRKGQLEGHQINKGDKIVFTSVGAGMAVNAMVYQF